jgi:hypothetical protein
MTKPDFRSHVVSPSFKQGKPRKDHSGDIGNPRPMR